MTIRSMAVALWVVVSAVTTTPERRTSSVATSKYAGMPVVRCRSTFSTLRPSTDRCGPVIPRSVM